MRKSFSGVAPIRPGYTSEIRLTYPAAFFNAEELETGRIVAHVRNALGGPLAFTLDSDQDSIEREENALVLLMPADGTSKLGGGIAVWDFVRVSESGGKRPVPGRWIWPVHSTVTRNLGEAEGEGSDVVGGSAVSTATFEFPSADAQVDFTVAVVPGPQGKSFLIGADAPEDTLGRDGDVYINWQSGDLYEKTFGAWGDPLGNFYGGALAAAQSAADDAQATAGDRQAVADDRTAVTALKTAIDAMMPAIDTVANRDAEIATVANRDAQIATVAERDAEIVTVADIAVQIQTVAERDAEIAALAAIEAAIVTAAENADDIATVAANIDAVNDAAGALTIIQTAMLQMATAYADSQTRFIDAHAFE